MNKVFGLSSMGISSTRRVPKVSLFPGGYDTDSDTLLLLKCDEGEGVTAVDYSDYHHHGEIQSAQWTMGKYGYGLHFDGINDKVIIPHRPTLDLPGEFCLEAYIRPEDDGTQRIFEKSGAYYLELKQSGGKDKQVKFNAGIWSGGSIKKISSGWDYGLLEWLHVAFQRNQAGYLSLVVNGIEDAVSSFTCGPADTNTNDLLLGCGENGYFYKGDLDEVRISNVYRSIAHLDPNR